VILYHVTPAKNVKSIQKHGLGAKASLHEQSLTFGRDITGGIRTQMTDEGGLPGILYGDLPDFYGLRSLPNGNHLRVFKVDATGIDLGELSEEYGLAYTTEEVIPPDRLTLLETHQLPPMARSLGKPQPFTFKLTYTDPDWVPEAVERLEQLEDIYGPFADFPDKNTKQTVTFTVKNKGVALKIQGALEFWDFDPAPDKWSVTPRLTWPKDRR
jgi:hypothetical protein